MWKKRERRAGCMFLLIASASASLWLAGCANGSDSAGTPSTSVSGAAQGGQFAGVALPSSYTLDSGKSLALGVGERWIGRIVFTSSTSSRDMFDFYRSEMPKFGWNEGAVVQSETSILTFDSPATERTAIVQISSRTLGGAYVEMVVSPTASSAAGSNTTQGYSNNSSSRPVPATKPAARPPAVSAQPLQ
ncbi:MAG TPA: hypothetical protein VEJ16_12775 [Alphaproteobacteria bacterium]|nr:hypothetical protein [Alphaproteobacteria bacterium]